MDRLEWYPLPENNSIQNVGFGSSDDLFDAWSMAKDDLSRYICRVSIDIENEHHMEMLSIPTPLPEQWHLTANTYLFRVRNAGSYPNCLEP